ncbi:WG repeat-containing protein [Chitinophaga qingshengii]|uniref:WG repeat-containing protein n=1 Tax=Chitinophaga qingshengii TaxID=1569794 RepID=A0ABR7TXR1_9BACT|nr:WG repeat-containing protein [Chitinophaga qingshengii]MBC9934226.1 WG repeat-containing protein [Chitinophaga qingshengii]
MKRSLLVTPSLLLLTAAAFAQTPVTAGYLDRFEGDYARVLVNGQQQLLHRSGKLLIDKIEAIGDFRITAAVKNGAYGAVNNKGAVIAPFKYDAVRILADQNKEHPEDNYCLVLVKLQGKFGAVDSLGNVLCQPEYSAIDIISPRVFAIKKNGLYGWCDMKTGKVIQEPVYEEVSASYVREKALEIRSKGKAGIALEDGTVLVPPQYERFIGWNFDGELFSYYTANGKCGLMSKQGKVLSPAIYDDIKQGPSEDLVAVTVQGKTGLLQAADGKLKVPLQYTKAACLGPLFQVWKGNLTGILDSSGKEVIPVVNTEIKLYDAAGHSIYGALPNPVRYTPPYYCVVKKGNTAALFSESGKQIMPFDYTEIGVLPDRDKVFVIPMKGRQCGLADFSGKLRVPVQFDGVAIQYAMQGYDDDAAGDEKDHFIGVMKGGRIGLFNMTTGQLVIPAKYTDIRWQNPYMLCLKQNDSTCLADKTGKIIRALEQYGSFDAVSANLIVERNYKMEPATTLLINKQGKVLYQNKNWNFSASSYNRLLVPELSKTRPLQFNSGLLKVRGDGRENQFVDTTGALVVFDEYKYVGDFWNGLALAAKEERQFGIINRDKKVVYPLVLDDMSPLGDDLLLAKQGDKRGLLRKDGTVFLPLEYENITQLYDTTFYVVTRQGKQGVLNAEGKELIPAAYDEIRYYKTLQLFEVAKDGKKGWLAIDGKAIIAPVYDDMEQNQDWDSNSLFPLLVKQGEWYFYLDEQGKELPYRSKKRKGYDE